MEIASVFFHSQIDGTTVSGWQAEGSANEYAQWRYL
jgi:hypothetical protein